MIPQQTIEDLKKRVRPRRCPNSTADIYWDDYGCELCGARYHCAECGAGTGMYGHHTTTSDGYKDHWCRIAEG